MGRISQCVCTAILGLVMLAACAELEVGGQPTLYQRLGGKEAIAAVVDKFVDNVARDERINKFFSGTNLPQLKVHLVDQICETTGGPCTYTGRSMKATHAGMGVSDAHFEALVQDLVAALDFYKVGQAEKDELLAALGSMRGDIVER